MKYPVSPLKLVFIGLITVAVAVSCLGMAASGDRGRVVDAGSRPLTLSDLGSAPLAAALAAPSHAPDFAPVSRADVALAELACAVILGAIGAAGLGSALGSRFVSPLRL